MPAHSRATDRHLATVDHRLAAVVREAIRRAHPLGLRIVVTEGRRDEVMHAELMRLAGARSWQSPSVKGLGVRLAVIVARRERTDLPLLFRVAEAMRDAAAELRVDVKWCWTWRLVGELPAVVDHRIGPGAGYADAQGFVVAG